MFYNLTSDCTKPAVTAENHNDDIFRRQGNCADKLSREITENFFS